MTRLLTLPPGARVVGAAPLRARGMASGWQQTVAGLWWRVQAHSPDEASCLLALDCAAHHLPAPRHEVQVDRATQTRWDCAFVEAGWLVDCQGGLHGGKGKHSQAEGYAKDTRKWAQAILAGWRILIVTTGQVNDGTAVAWVAQALHEEAL